MQDYRSNVTLREAGQKILAAKHLAITTHAKPDGDAFGSVMALSGVLEQLGKSVAPWLMPPVPKPFQSLQGWGMMRLYEQAGRLGQPDLVVVLDTGAWSQVPAIRDDLTPLLDRTLIVDHHLSGDIPSAWRYIDGQAAACCEIVAELIDVLADLARGQSDDDCDTSSASSSSSLLNAAVSEALYVGLSSDTGWFRFSNTRPYSHELAGRLLRLGVDHARLYSVLEQNERPQKLSLLTRALDGLRLVADNQAAVMVLREQDFVETGAKLEETERFVDTPQVVSSVQVVALITQIPSNGQIAATSPVTRKPVSTAAASHTKSTPDPMPPNPGPIRLSLRSKPGPDAVNVAKLAQSFGGGGHARAAAAQLHGCLDDVIQQVSTAVTEAIGPNK